MTILTRKNIYAEPFIASATAARTNIKQTLLFSASLCVLFVFSCCAVFLTIGGGLSLMAKCVCACLN